MKAMLLAAGRGERMRPLTDTCPKPLLRAGGKSLLQWHIERLVAAGITEIVINHAHLGAQIEAAFGDGAAYGADIRYSPEPAGALETAGGIRQALPLLGNAPFLVISGDIHCDWPLENARNCKVGAGGTAPLAHLVMVPNPDFHPEGDFGLRDGLLSEAGAPQRLTFGNIGVYHPAMFADITPGSVAKLGPMLRALMRDGRVSGELYEGAWTNVGTPQQLAELDRRLQGRPA
jgi:MurNAc alpha-1-phosphate uridylyltransferase